MSTEISIHLMLWFFKALCLYSISLSLHFNTSNVMVLPFTVKPNALNESDFNTSNVMVLLRQTAIHIHTIQNFNTSNVMVLLKH